jgi:hypothetical protein
VELEHQSIESVHHLGLRRLDQEPVGTGETESLKLSVRELHRIAAFDFRATTDFQRNALGRKLGAE